MGFCKDLMSAKYSPLFSKNCRCCMAKMCFGTILLLPTRDRLNKPMWVFLMQDVPLWQTSMQG